MLGLLLVKRIVKELLNLCHILIDRNMLHFMQLQAKIEFKPQLLLFLLLKQLVWLKIYLLKLYGETQKEHNFHGQSSGCINVRKELHLVQENLMKKNICKIKKMIPMQDLLTVVQVINQVKLVGKKVEKKKERKLVKKKVKMLHLRERKQNQVKERILNIIIELE